MTASMHDVPAAERWAEVTVVGNLGAGASYLGAQDFAGHARVEDLLERHAGRVVLSDN